MNENTDVTVCLAVFRQYVAVVNRAIRDSPYRSRVKLQRDIEQRLEGQEVSVCIYNGATELETGLSVVGSQFVLANRPLATARSRWLLRFRHMVDVLGRPEDYVEDPSLLELPIQTADTLDLFGNRANVHAEEERVAFRSRHAKLQWLAPSPGALARG